MAFADAAPLYSPLLVERLRRVDVPDRYEPEAVEPGPWSTAAAVPIPGSWVAASSAVLGGTADVQLLTTRKSLYCSPVFDIQDSDRVRYQGVVYDVDATEPADYNPWSLWRPIREVPLTKVSDG